jgi:hypothetical protein
MRRGGAGAVAEAMGFFMRNDPVHGALREIAARLDAAGVPYAVAGGMALVAHGYDRTTVDVDVLVTPAGLDAVLSSLVGLGYRPAFEGARTQIRDAERGVRIEFLVAGEYPGDGRPKPVAFPDPSTVSVEIGGVRYLALPTLVELKLASGKTNKGRLKDLADVQELIRALALPLEFRDRINAYVRDDYTSLWEGVQGDRQG